MQSNSIKILFLSLIISVLSAQFKDEVSGLSLPKNMHIPKETHSSFLSPNRFNIQHGFSMNMVQMGGQSVGVGSYSNQMNYFLTDKLKLRLNFILLQSNISQQPGLNNNIYYGAGLDYQLTENALFQFTFQTIPTYQRFQSLTLNPLYSR